MDPISLAQHFRHVLLVRTRATNATDALASFLARHHTIEQRLFETLEEARNWLLPLNHFASRYVIRRYGNWTAIVSNGVGVLPIATAVPRRLGARSYELMWRAEQRLVRASDERGKRLRFAHVYRDGGWHCDVQGTALEQEDEAWYQPRKTADRLRPEHVRELLHRLSPDCHEEPWTQGCDHVHVVGAKLPSDFPASRELPHVDDLSGMGCAIPARQEPRGATYEPYMAAEDFLKVVDDSSLAAGDRHCAEGILRALASLEGVEDIRIELSAWEQVEGSPHAEAVWIRGADSATINGALGDLVPDQIEHVSAQDTPPVLRGTAWARLWWD